MKPSQFVSLAAFIFLWVVLAFAPHTKGGFFFLIGSYFACVPLALLPMLDDDFYS